MAKTPTTSDQEQDSLPTPEVLHVRSEDDESQIAPVPSKKPSVKEAVATKVRQHMDNHAYRPSHKATFVGLAVVAVVLAINTGIITMAMRSKTAATNAQGNVVVGQGTLDKLGVSRNNDNNGIELVFNPDVRFSGKAQISGDVSIGGRLKLNNKLEAATASLTQLQAGSTSLEQLNVNGTSTVTTLNLRNDLLVAGAAKFQGGLTSGGLVTIANNANVTGSMSVGGVLTVGSFQTSNLTSTSTLTIGGHVITRGTAPSVTTGAALGPNGTTSISGNDVAGTVAANAGVGASSGIIASVTFRTPYSNIPKVVVTAASAGAGSVYVNRSASGFNIGVNGPLPPGGYAFDYIVMQ